MLKKIAVTGGLASGKTTVCDVFQELGAYVVSADQIVHQLLSKSAVIQKVEKLLGSQVVKDAKIKRDQVANLVFTNPTLLHKLEALMHPLVFKEIKNQYKKAIEKKATLFVAEVPLLFEAGFDSFFDQTVAVVAPENECEKRFGKDYAQRMSRQLNPEHKAQKANYIIENLGSLEELKTKAKNLFTKSLK